MRTMAVAIAVVFMSSLGFSSMAMAQQEDASGMSGMSGMSGQDIEVGIANQDQARTVAETWLKVVNAGHLSPGNIQEIDEIFIVSIVDKNDKKKLIDQLIVRKPDGYVFPVFPFGIPTKEEVKMMMMGMQGMRGMQGMQGMYGMPGQHRGQQGMQRRR